MDQKNTIVKCAKHKCLFNNRGTCEQYVITIGIDNTCQAYTETEGFTFKEQKTCHPDCVHFDDSDPMVGPICLFKHPKPLKNFYEGMPCDYYHKRGHRAKCDLFEDEWVNPEIVKEVCQPFTMSDHLCDIRCVSAHYAENGELYCALIHDFPARPLRCSAYDDGGEE